MGIPSGKAEEEREGYQDGVLILHDLDYLVTEAAEECHPQQSLKVDLCDPLPIFPQATNASSFRHRFYSSTPNSFIHLAASRASFAYKDGTTLSKESEHSSNK